MAIMKMATVLLVLCLSSVVIGEDLTPFIAWSTDRSLSNLNSQSTLAEAKNAIASSSVSVVVVFACEELSFDDIMKYGGAYGSNNAFAQLKSSMDLAPFQYWKGMKMRSAEWGSGLDSRLGKEATFVNENDIAELDPKNGFYVIKMSSSNFARNDAIIGKVMDRVKEGGASYLAIYTRFALQSEARARSRRSSVEIREEADQAQDSNLNDDCGIGGQLTYIETNNNETNNTRTNNTCMLFCLKGPITYHFNNKNASCKLSTPYNLTYFCLNTTDTNNTTNNTTNENVETSSYGGSYPSVTVSYFVDNENHTGSNNNGSNDTGSNNNCSWVFWNTTFIQQPDGPRHANAKAQMYINLTFFFPTNFSYSTDLSKKTGESWAVMVSSKVTMEWVPEEDGPPRNPPDEENDDDLAYFTKTWLMTRNRDRQSLAENFTVYQENSYACSASSLNTYVTSDYDVLNDTLVILPATWNVTNGSTDQTTALNESIPFLSLVSIQVQPYGFENDTTSATFASADNCVGYFTEVTWMGIVSMGILLVIFYLAILCTFSMKSLDQFEDPRGQTISVEKLH